MAQKKTILLDDSDSEIDDLNLKAEKNSAALKINADYAKRFEHNKKREELHRLEEKYGQVSVKRRRADSRSSSGSGSEGDSSSDEDEDEQGELITDAIDSEIAATLAAIRNKDPRVYNSEVVFFPGDGDLSSTEKAPKKEKSMTLKQYHQTNILSGYTGNGDDGDDKNGDDLKGRVNLYDREQEELKRELIGALNGALSESEDEDMDLFKRKEKPHEEQETQLGRNDAVPEALPTNPDADPERYLDIFFSTKAWMTKGDPRDAAFESDDSEDERAASDFENAYNLRFEDPSLASRAVITTHSRDVASKLTLRREEKSKRKKARDLKKEKKEREMSTQKSEQKRLRKLKIEELEKKFEMVKEAGGLDASKLDVGGTEGNDDWVTFLEQEWNGADDWDTNMTRFFGSDYYSKREEKKEGKKPKKPTWEDDIDIKDIVPDFEDGEVDAQGSVKGIEITSQDEPMSIRPDGDDYDMELVNDSNEGENESSPVHSKSFGTKSKGKSKDPEVSDKIKSFVDDHLKVMSIRSSSKAPSSFRYRAVSPQSFHLSSSDILFASDKQLNEYAGLKKLASFRDEKKKTKDLRRYTKGNKYKLREWRKEVFADGIPSPSALAGVLNGTPEGKNAGEVVASVKQIEIVGKDDDTVESTRQSGGRRAKKRRRKSKTSAAV